MTMRSGLLLPVFIDSHHNVFVRVDSRLQIETVIKTEIETEIEVVRNVSSRYGSLVEVASR